MQQIWHRLSLIISLRVVLWVDTTFEAALPPISVNASEEISDTAVRRTGRIYIRVSEVVVLTHKGCAREPLSRL